MKKWALVVVILFSLFAAAFIRLSGLDRKFYWIDEVSSSFVITGHFPLFLEGELHKTVGNKIKVGAVLNLLERDPDRNPFHLLHSLAEEDPQHPPLYYLLAQQIGTRPAALRSLAAVLGWIGIPCFAWLCLELFGSMLAGMIGLILLSFAPFHILYSQQNREYSLWFTITILSTALLLAANRTNRLPHWIAYGLSIVAGLYTFLYFMPFLLSHAVFQWLESRTRKDPRIRRFSVAIALGLISFVPWALILLAKSGEVQEMNKWSSQPLAFSVYAQGLVLGFSRLFTDFDTRSFRPLPWNQPTEILCIFLVCAIILYAFIRTAKSLHGPKRHLLISIFLIPLLLLFSLDLIIGGRHALLGRHLIPTWIAVYLAVTYAITLDWNSRDPYRRMLAGACMIFLLTCAMQFYFSYGSEMRWWCFTPKALAEAAAEINLAQPEVLLLPEPIKIKQFISIAYSLERELPLLVLGERPAEPKPYRKIAVYRPGANLLNSLSTDFTLTSPVDDLWLGVRR